MMTLFNVLTGIMVLARATTQQSPSVVTVDTALGKVSGLEIKIGDKTMRSFYGIPYAEPPKRFRKPEPVKPWSSTFSATTPGGKICPQKISDWMANFLPSIDINEDCLLLDIHVPMTGKTNIPVIIWFHADNFDFGQRGLTIVNDLTFHGEVINVVVAFRLGVFGFLSTGDSNVPGNFALWDQKLSIEWVKQNINSFGGDPNKITLSGFQSGSAMAALQATTSLNSGNFQRIVLFSGAANAPGLIWQDHKEYAQKISQNLCPPTVQFDATAKPYTSKEVYDCLMSKSMKEIIDASNGFKEGHMFGRLTFGPVIDNDFIQETTDLTTLLPVDLLAFLSENELFSKIYERTSPYTSQYKFKFEDHLPKEFLKKVFVESIVQHGYRNVTDKTSLSDFIMAKYSSDDKDEQSRNALRIIADYYVNTPVMQVLRNHADTHGNKNSYLCLYGRRSPLNQLVNTIPWLTGTTEADPVGYLTALISYQAFYPDLITQVDINVALRTIKYTSKFIYTGDTNDDTDQTAPFWSPYVASDQAYLRLNITTEKGKDLFKDRVDFWLEDVPHFIDPTTTGKPTTTTLAPTTTTKAPPTTTKTKTTPSSLNNNQPTTPAGGPINTSNTVTTNVILMLFCFFLIIIPFWKS